MNRQLLLSICIGICIWLLIPSAPFGGAVGKPLPSGGAMVTSPPPLNEEAIVQLMKQHYARLLKEQAGKSAFTAMKPRWKKLVRPDVLSFSTKGALTQIQEAIKDGKHHYTSKKFPDIYVAVSALPTMDTSRGKQLFGGRIDRFMDILMNESGFTSGDFDFAHWIYTREGEQDGIHLQFLPSYRFIKTQGRDVIAIIAEDFK